MHNLVLNQVVSYRYMNVAPGVILDISADKKQVLLAVDDDGVKFTKWVHWTSVNPVAGRPIKSGLFAKEMIAEAVENEAETAYSVRHITIMPSIANRAHRIQ